MGIVLWLNKVEHKSINQVKFFLFSIGTLTPLALRNINIITNIFLIHLRQEKLSLPAD